MKLITFALWGDSPKYGVGATKNAWQAALIYPDWTCRFYVADDAPEEYVEALKSFKNAQVVHADGPSDWTFSYNRFLPMSEEGVEAVISRDTDSRLHTREASAVDEWLNSDKSFHIMKDHPWHYSYPILAGMFGCKSGVIDNIEEKIEKFTKIDTYHSDKDFLKDIIYPIVSENCMVHDDFRGQPFPESRTDLQFVGQVFDERDCTVPEHLLAMQQYIWDNVSIPSPDTPGSPKHDSPAEQIRKYYAPMLEDGTVTLDEG